MNGLPSFLPERASTLADRFEVLFWYMTIVVSIAAVLVYAYMFYCCIRYRRGRTTTGSTPRILGSTRLELAWTFIPLVVFLTFFAGGTLVYNHAFHPPADSMEVFVIGKQWMWKAQYPSGQRVIIGGNPRNMSETERQSIGKLVLPVGRPTKVTFISEDVIHDFGVPAFRSKMDVLPGRYTQAWYRPTKTGEFHVFCDQFCGNWHSLMVGKILVVEPTDFDRWLAGDLALQGTPNPVDGSLAQEGRNLFLKLQCIECHTAKATAKAPVLEELYGTANKRVRVQQPDGSAVTQQIEVDEAYILESILNPRAKVAEGWEPIMPSFKGQVTEHDLNALVHFIRSLKRGHTPDRTERTEPPVGAPTQRPEPKSPEPKSPEKK